MATVAALRTIDTADRILWNVQVAKRPGLAAAKACSKVGYLARRTDAQTERGERDGIQNAMACAYHHLSAALNEQRHGMLQDELAKSSNPDTASRARDWASRHYEERDREIAAFKRAVVRARG